MPATIVSRSRSSFTLQIEIPYSGSMLEFEESMQRAPERGWSSGYPGSASDLRRRWISDHCRRDETNLEGASAQGISNTVRRCRSRATCLPEPGWR